MKESYSKLLISWQTENLPNREKLPRLSRKLSKRKKKTSQLPQKITSINNINDKDFTGRKRKTVCCNFLFKTTTLPKKAGVLFSKTKCKKVVQKSLKIIKDKTFTDTKLSIKNH